MGPRRLLLTAAVLLLALAARREASEYCGRLEYWNADNECCGSCLQRFGPPPCPDYEFAENCGFDDYGDLITHPFRECSPGQCNPDGAELCGPCDGGTTVSTPATPAFSRGGSRLRCRERPVPAKGYCPLTPGNPCAPSSPASSSSSKTSERDASQEALPSFVLPLVLLLLLTWAVIVILLLALRMHLCRHKGKAVPFPPLGSVCGGPSAHTLSSLLSPPGALEALETGKAGKVSLLPLQSKELPSLASQPLSRLLDELEVLEELIVLLDPEPGPGGGMSCGTTRHLAARYGMPATWSTFTYSLRPSRSPLRALIEMVVAREPSASLGQLGAHLAQLGRADALQVLSKLG
nr:IGF-like family receptor 1 isoform X1 [Microcebus murinus]XP_012630469.1 IGF-like family receptor 1 isoform X1 [Microcebus murinus]XP_012630470.1 IGF-like family receptor 1 isoform X1 [Microcebus murinus]XP_012630471.1 IGF-like family receptor 1 isoform X1 [Microcebus murinus]XP_012630472.1 IGF-like family receptor 1 isoform X1 [Microcebus murinus]XP_012630473.1 IGF-like family receptor 1 isoform X1 [Microcebus murinus]XP_012630474.1 IGF-like family receptor 1 isoform X1 [Microcebus murinu